MLQYARRSDRGSDVLDGVENTKEKRISKYRVQKKEYVIEVVDKKEKYK